MLRNSLKFILKILARAVLKRQKPEIVAITGSVGKTSTKEACFKVFKQKFNTWCTPKNYNTEIGVPLAIIGVVKTPKRSFLKWFKVFLKALFFLIFKTKKYPEILILELGADKPGDIAYFMSFIKPDVSIITAINKVHLANFHKFSQLIAEKRQIIESLDQNSYAVLNFDDELIVKNSNKTSARILSYGLKNSKAKVKAKEVKIISRNQQLGLYFKLMYKNTVMPVFIRGLLAKHQIYSLLAAVACGLIYDITPVNIAHGLENFSSLKGRFNLIKSSKGYCIIDDTYNASLPSVRAALESLAALPLGKRKVAVLADMLELGSVEKLAHLELGKIAKEQELDLLFTYGKRAGLIAQSAKEQGFDQTKIFSFSDQKKLIQALKDQLKKEDLVLIKGSNNLKMKKVVLGLS